MHGCDAKLVQYVAGVMVMFFFSCRICVPTDRMRYASDMSDVSPNRGI